MFWALEDDEFYFEHVKCAQWGSSQAVGYMI